MSQIPKSSMREEYLRKIWIRQPYPLANAPLTGGVSVFRGRLGSFSGPEGHLQLESMEKIQDFQGGRGLELHRGFPWDQCLMGGDILEVWGRSTGDKVQIESIRLLVPVTGPSPFKKSTFDASRARQWAAFMVAIREIFQSWDFIELRTPTLVPSPGLEPFLDAFETDFQWGRVKKHFYLPTSPEFHLKKALTLGYEKIFEFKECFRNGELGGHHQPEFMMLEWYRAYADGGTLMEDVAELLRRLQSEAGTTVHEAVVVTMENLWRQCLDFNLTPETKVEDLRRVADRTGVSVDPSENFDDLFARIFLEKIETVLAQRPEPVIVHHYPPSQAALSRLTSEGWADRFELYWRGLEIANAFLELNDPVEQRRRFLQDQEKKRQLGKQVVPVDEEFLQALEWGMPPSAGIALGVERLFMALHGLKSIEELRLFPMGESVL